MLGDPLCQFLIVLIELDQSADTWRQRWVVLVQVDVDRSGIEAGETANLDLSPIVMFASSSNCWMVLSAWISAAISSATSPGWLVATKLETSAARL